MAGPSLALGVNAAGKETLIGLNEQLGLLRTNLAALKGSGKTDLSGLSSAAAEIKKFRSEFADSNAGLRTSFAELSEAIKGGLTKASTEAESGGKKLRSSVARERAQLQAEYEKMLADGRRFTDAELAVMKDAGVRLAAAQVAKLKATSVVSRDNKSILGGGAFSNPLPAGARDSEVEAAWAAHNKAQAGRIAVTKAEAFALAENEAQKKIQQVQAQSFKGFAEIERKFQAERAAEKLSGSKATTTGLKEAAAEQSAAEVWKAKMQTGSLQIAEAQAKAAATVEAAAFARKAKLQLGSLAIEEAQAKAAAKEATSAAEWKAKLLLGSLQIANEMEAAAQRINAANGRYIAATEKAQLRTQVRARGALDAGLPRERVDLAFGSTATQAAAEAPSLDALKKAHQEIGATADAAKPKIKGMAQAMGDLHSAARGVASGFGAMFLTWGNIAPLLAGAALSNAFVQTVKQGASVEQTLSVIKNLSNETDAAVDGLRTRLLSLASNGPQGPLEIAKAMKALSLAGLDAAQVSVSVKDALTLSIVGEMPVEKAAEQLVAVSTAYGYAAGQFSRVNDIIGKTAAISMSSVSGMSESFRVSSVVAQQYGATLEDTATQLALLANIGIRNQQAGTAVTQFYANMSGTTKKGADALKSLGIEATDASGRMKPLVELVRLLNEGLAKKTPKGQNEALEAIFNNRGQRDALAVRNASLKPATDASGNVMKDAAGNIITEFQRVQKEVIESYGFATVAMANLSLTAENQMKSVGAAFQGSLVQAFKELEPAILVVSQRLREMFNSSEFQSTLVGLVTTVGNFAATLIQHAEALKIGAAALLVYKGAMITSAVFSAAAVGVTGLAQAVGVLRGATLLSAGAMLVLRGAMGPIGLVLGAAAAAWVLYQTMSNKSAITAAEVATVSAGQIVEAIEKENARLRIRNQLIKDGNDQRQADIKLAALQVEQEQNVKNKKGQDEVGGKVLALQAALAEVDSRAKLKTPDGKEIAFQGDKAERNRLQSQLNAQLTEQHLIESQILRDKIAYRNATGEANRLAEEASRLPGGSPKPPAAPAGLNPFAQVKPDPTALTGRKREFADEMSLITQRYGNEQKLLDLKNKGKLISDAAYAFQSEQIAENQYRDEMVALQKHYDDSTSLIAALRAKNKGGKTDAEESGLLTKAAKYKEDLDFARAQAAIRKESAGNKVDESFAVETAKIAQTVTLARTQQQIAQDTANLTEKQIAYYNAENTSLATSAEFLRTKRVELEKLRAELARVSAPVLGPTDDAYIAALQKQLDAKTEQVDAFVVERNKNAAALGQIAADNAQPNWQKMLEGFKNTVQQMESAYNEVVEGFVTKGQTIFADIFKTGKISLKSLLDLVQDVLVKQVYQTQIAPLFADMGKLVAGQIFPQGGKNPNYGNEGNNFKISGVDTAASNTTSAFTALQTTGIMPATTGLGSLVLALEAAAAAAYRLASSGGGGGGVIGQFLGGSSGAGAGGDGFTTNPQAGYALGGTFGFARGGAFTNSVVTERTPFNFKNGNKFSRGEMGEAGPEAVMPLRRGANGALGVAVMGGAGGGNNTSVEVHNYGDGKARTQETKNPDGSKVIRVIIDQAKREVAGDIQRGGMIGDAVETQYGMNRANGLPRR